jgi:hypothetical protein
MKSLRWTRTDTAGWRSGDFEIVVTGETATARPVLWGLKHKGEWVMEPSARGASRERRFERLRDVKRAAEIIRRAE